MCLAEEIDTPGEGQIRGLVTVAGNPVLSTPNADRLDAALATLDAYVAVDPYVNETTRHADVILPVPSALQRGHYDLFLSQLALRNVARYTPPVLPRDPGLLDEWEVLARLALVAAGLGPAADDPAPVDDELVRSMAAAAVADPSSPVQGRDADEIVKALGDRRGPERLLDLLLRTGPYGEGFGADSSVGCRSTPCWPHRTASTSARSSPACRRCCARRAAWSSSPPSPWWPTSPASGRRSTSVSERPRALVLIGRRHLRSNNSWMHNLSILVKGRPRCTLLVHPDDAARLGLADGRPAEVASRAGR